MRIAGPSKAAWVEGVVDRRADHVSVTYGESRKAVALIAQRANKGFRVQFLLKARRADPRTTRILDEVQRELTFYLLDVVGPDSWPFVQYHCETPANRRSIVHWSWHPKPAPRKRRTPPALAGKRQLLGERSSAGRQTRWTADRAT